LAIAPLTARIAVASTRPILDRGKVACLVDLRRSVPIRLGRHLCDPPPAFPPVRIG
jgi:hypothetical protein